MGAGSCFLFNKDIKIEQLSCGRFIKTPVQHFGVNILMLKSTLKVTCNVEDIVESMQCLS